MEEDLKDINEIKSNPPIKIRRDIKDLGSCGAAYGCMCRDKYTNNLDLDELKTDNNKNKKEKMRYKDKIRLIISSLVVLKLSWERLVFVFSYGHRN